MTHGGLPSWLVARCHRGWCGGYVIGAISLDLTIKRIVIFLFFLLWTRDIHIVHLTEEWMTIEQNGLFGTYSKFK